MKASILKAIVEFRNFAGWESLQIDFSGSNKFPIFIIYDLWANSACTIVRGLKKMTGQTLHSTFWTLDFPCESIYHLVPVRRFSAWLKLLSLEFVCILCLEHSGMEFFGYQPLVAFVFEGCCPAGGQQSQKVIVRGRFAPHPAPPPERDLPPLSPHRHRLGAVTVGSGLRTWYDKISNWCATDALGFWMILMLLTVTQEKGSQENMYCWAVISLYFLPFLTGLEVLLVLCIRGMRCRSFSLQ